MTDTIADLLTRIRNANEAKHASVKVPFSKLKQSIVTILKKEGYISDYALNENGIMKDISIDLKYTSEGTRVITSIERVSTPGRRVYVAKKDIPKVLSGLGICILTTPKGVMTGIHARVKNVGGELLCKVW